MLVCIVGSPLSAAVTARGADARRVSVSILGAGFTQYTEERAMPSCRVPSQLSHGLSNLTGLQTKEAVF